MDNMDGAELTVNYALPERIKGGEQGWSTYPIWADEVHGWRQQQEQEMLRLQAEQKAAMQVAEDLHNKKMAEDLDGEMMKLRQRQMIPWMWPKQRAAFSNACCNSCLLLPIESTVVALAL